MQENQSIDYDLDKVCRSCLSEDGDMKNMFEYEETETTNNINEMMMACAQVQVIENDGMPSKICTQCITQLNSSFTFKQRCERSDATLRDYITRKHPNIKLAPVVKQELYGDDFHLPIKPEITIVESDPLTENFYEGGDNNFDNDSDGEIILNHKRSKRTRRGKDNTFSNVKLNKTKLSPFECDYCDKILVDAKGLTLHTRLHTGEHLKHCGICNRGFAKMSHLNRHITTMHADDTMEVSDSKEIKEEPDEQSSSTTANIEEEAPEEAITEPVVEEPKKSSVKKKYKCQFCTESFDERNQLSLHIVSHKESPRKRGRPSKRDTQLRIQKQKEQKRLDKLQDSNEGSQNQSSDADSSNDEDKPLSAFRDMKNDVKTEIDELADGNCTMCDRVITNFDKLRVHLRKHTGEKLASCKICGQNFIQKSQLKRHLMTHCNINTYRGVELRLRPDLFKGDYSEDGKEEPILDTDTQETLVDRIMRYLTEKGAEGVNRFIQVTTTSAIDMFTESESSDSENEQNGSTTLASKRRYQYCSVCNAAFLRSDHIIRHMSTHDPSQFDDKCEVCERVFPNRDLLERHRRSQCENVEKQHKCKVCKVKFTEESTLRKHETKHTNPPPSVSFASHIDSNKSNSSKFKEPREKSFQCSMCEKAFYRAEHLDRHTKTHIITEKKFECNICQKKFNRKDNLRSHQRVHKEEKEDCDKHLCVYCGRSFSNSSNLIVHMRRHTGEKPYRCDICNKGFPRSSDLQCHRRTHTGEKPCLCTICGKGFSRSNKLVRHMRIHTGQRPYKCTFCDRAFTQSNDLTLHIRRHTGDKPYVCGICGDRFIQGTALQAHRRMQGHFEELNQPTPFASISCNNPNRYNNPNRVNRIGGAPPSPPPIIPPRIIVTSANNTGNNTQALPTTASSKIPPNVSTTTSGLNLSSSSTSTSSASAHQQQAVTNQTGAQPLMAPNHHSNAMNSLNSNHHHAARGLLSGFPSGSYMPNGSMVAPFLANANGPAGVLMQNLDVTNALGNIPLFSISQYNQGYN